MPTYQLKNEKTGEIKEEFMSISNMEKLIGGGEWSIYYAPTSNVKIISQAGGILSKTDDGWKDTLKRIKKHSGRNNTIRV